MGCFGEASVKSHGLWNGWSERSNASWFRLHEWPGDCWNCSGFVPVYFGVLSKSWGQSSWTCLGIRWTIQQQEVCVVAWSGLPYMIDILNLFLLDLPSYLPAFLSTKKFLFICTVKWWPRPLSHLLWKN